MALLLSESAGRDARQVGWVHPSDSLEGQVLFEFTDDQMAPAFPKGTRVVLEVIKSPDLVVGTVYLQVFSLDNQEDSRWMGVGRLAAIREQRVGWPLLDFTRDCDGQEHWQNVVAHVPRYYWYTVKAYVSKPV